MIEEPIVLAYKGNHSIRGDLGDVELNCTMKLLSIVLTFLLIGVVSLPPKNNLFKN